MLRYGYDRRVAAGVIAASGTLAQIIPPSLVLIVMADQLGRSVGDMYEGAFIPGILLAGLYALYIFFVTILFPKAAPGLPIEAVGFREDDNSRGLPSLAILALASGVFAWFVMRGSSTRGADFVVLTMFIGIVFAFCIAVINWGIDRATGFRFLSRMAQQVTFAMVPPLFLIFLVLGTIFIGLATPTEGGAMGATGALLLALAKGRLNWDHGETGDGIHGETLLFRGVHSGRRPHLFADLLRRRRPPLGRGPCWSRCRADRSDFLSLSTFSCFSSPSFSTSSKSPSS